MSDATIVNTELLRDQVREKYRAVAVEPDATYHFHTGRTHASRLDYDESIVAYRDSRRLLDIDREDTIVGGLPPFNGAVIAEGRLVGHWKRRFTKDAVEIEAALHHHIPTALLSELEAEAARYAAFVEADRCSIVRGCSRPPPHPRPQAAPQLLPAVTAAGGGVSHPTRSYGASWRSTELDD